MKNVVNNTTKFNLFDLLCPYSCRGCGVLGSPICERCKKYLIQPNKYICPICRRDFVDDSGIMWRCTGCDSLFELLWVVGWREDLLNSLVTGLKYKSERRNAEDLAELIDAKIPDKDSLIKYLKCRHRDPENITVVPLPTIAKHIRKRGLDHTDLIVKKLAKMRGWKREKILGRTKNTVQVGARAEQRKTQAQNAYYVVQRVDPHKTYLLLDDVWTTGSTMLAAEQALRNAGAKRIWGVVVMCGKPTDDTKQNNNSE